jgi:hypothetical protein
MLHSMLQTLIARLRDAFAELPQVEALAISGSRARTDVIPDAFSDIDFYVFTRADIPLVVRQRIVDRMGGAVQVQLDQRFWGLSDQWIDGGTGIHVDLNYFDAQWMEDAIVRVVEQHQASLGYTTCFWRTIRQSTLLFDRGHWLAELKARADVEYPEPLRRNIVALNHPVLRSIHTSYANQIAKAVVRNDPVSINHRVAALLASYFDCVFAASRVAHPGEKRLLELAVASCEWRPHDMVDDVTALLRAAAVEPTAMARRLAALLDKLDASLMAAGLDVSRP